jgi:hypothetical protein
MDQINKIDYFVGVFLAKIIGSTHIVPLLFDASNESKRIQFENNSKEFNLYVKYSTKRQKTEGSKNKNRKGKTYWKINFTQLEYDKFIQSYDEHRANYLVIICTNPKLDQTWIAIVDFEKAKHCLRNITPTGMRTITVTRFGNGQEFTLTGVGFHKDELETCLFDYTQYLL